MDLFKYKYVLINLAVEIMSETLKLCAVHVPVVGLCTLVTAFKMPIMNIDPVKRTSEKVVTPRPSCFDVVNPLTPTLNPTLCVLL